MNLIPKIAEMLGVEIGEEFELYNEDSNIRYNSKYMFTDNCLACADEDELLLKGVKNGKR